MVENFLGRFNLKPNPSFNELLCAVTDWVFIDQCQLSWFVIPASDIENQPTLQT